MSDEKVCERTNLPLRKTTNLFCITLTRRSKLYIACSGFFCKKPERAHAAAPPPQIPTATLGWDLVGRPKGGILLFWKPREIALLGGVSNSPGAGAGKAGIRLARRGASPR